MRLATLTGLLLFAAVPAFAAPGVWQWEQMSDVASSPAMGGKDLPAHVGDWVYATDGSIIGSLDSARGETAVLHVSSFFDPANTRISVPAANVHVYHDKLVIEGTSFDKLR